jgi:phosphoribosyl 1,2-cyclic phosphodiesterase
MRIRFWGVRGSYPVPGPATNRYGGNTVCVQVTPGNGSTLILDAGTGIRRLGKEMMSGPFGRGEGICHLLISHTHWDHIQGLPFFAPLYVAGNRIVLYARQRDVHLRTLFASQTEAPYFPVSLEEAAAQVSYAELLEGTCFEAGGVHVCCARLNHPNIAIGYRLDADGAAVAYVADTAHFDHVLLENDFIGTRPTVPPPEPAASELRRIREGVVELCRGCELVIYDTMFRPEEHAVRPHWGHSTGEYALEVVEEAGAKGLVLFHHSPERSDDELDADLAALRRRARISVLAAAEGMELEVGGGSTRLLGSAS